MLNGASNPASREPRPLFLGGTRTLQNGVLNIDAVLSLCFTEIKHIFIDRMKIISNISET